MAKSSGLEAGGKFIEGILEDIRKAPRTGDNAVPLSDKLKAFDSWVKFKGLEAKVKSGGLGSGFDQGGNDDETGDL